MLSVEGPAASLTGLRPSLTVEGEMPIAHHSGLSTLDSQLIYKKRPGGLLTAGRGDSWIVDSSYDSA